MNIIDFYGRIQFNLYVVYLYHPIVTEDHKIKIFIELVK